MKFLKNWLMTVGDNISNSTPTVTGVTDPVITIIKLFKDKPKDFNLELRYMSRSTYDFTLTHTPTDINIYIKVDKWFDSPQSKIKLSVGGIDITPEEETLLGKTFYDYYKGRKDRLHSLYQERLDRGRSERLKLAREEMTKLLKGED